MKRSTLGVICAFFANLIFGFSFIFSRMALDTADVFVLLTWRFLVSFTILAVIALIFRSKVSFKGKNIPLVLALGLLQPFLYFIFEQYGILMTTASFSGVLLATVPVVVMAVSGVFLGERPRGIQIFFGLLSLAGVSAISLISESEGRVEPLGILMLVLAVVSAALFNILSRKISGEFSPLERTLAMFLVGLVGFSLIGAFKFQGEFISKMGEAVSDPRFVVSLVYLAVLSSVVAFLIYNFATTHISVVQASAFSNIITVVSVLAGVFILGESFGTWEILSCILIIIGVFGVNYFAKNEKN